MTNCVGPNDKCVILVPFSHNIEPECDRALRALESRGYAVWRVHGYSAIDQGRSFMATDALAMGFEELMWVDSDIGFEADDFEKLRKHELPIVCGIYPTKGGHSLACEALPGSGGITFGQPGLTEINYAATGFLYTKAEVYRTIQNTLNLPTCNHRWKHLVVPYFLPLIVQDPLMPGSSRYFGEDFSFIHRAKQCGYRVMADTSIRLSHIGRYHYQWEDANTMLPRNQTHTVPVKD